MSNLQTYYNLKLDFQKTGPTYRRQMVNSRHQTPQGQCTMSQVPISIPWHREYWNIHLKAHLKPHSIKSSNTQVSALIPRPVLNGIERMCLRHGSNQNSHPPVLVRRPLCNQFIHYHISSRGINHFKLRNFAVVEIECSFATVYRSSIMARIHRCSVMIYGILQAEFMETKYNSHIHGYGTSVFGKIVVNIS